MNIQTEQIDEYTQQVQIHNRQANQLKHDICNNHCTIMGWMIQKLGLKGTELLVYAKIYGFSQDGENWYEGSLDYLTQWTNTSKEGVRKCLNSLVEKNLIQKQDITVNNVKFCKYRAILGNNEKLTPSTTVDATIPQLTNNVVYDVSSNTVLDKTNISTSNISQPQLTPPTDNNKSTRKTGLNFPGVTPQKTTTKKTQNHIDAIVDRFQNKDIRDNLVKYFKWLNSTEQGGISLTAWINNLDSLVECKQNFRDPNHMAEYIDWCIGRKRILRKKSPAGNSYNTDELYPQKPEQPSNYKMEFDLCYEPLYENVDSPE